MSEVASRHTASSNDDDDFGNFSDASFESENSVNESSEVMIDDAINDIFGKKDIVYDNNKDDNKVELIDLLADERPNVIYHELIDSDNRNIPAFMWNQSNLRATVLHILRLKDPLIESNKNNMRLPIEPVTLDDSLFKKIMNFVQETDIPVKESALLLKEQFSINYLPPLTQPSLADDYNLELKNRIPTLLKLQDNDNNDKTSENYHDTLCNAIDLLIVELRSLHEKQLQLETDKQTYERVITNLSGHTQRLQRDEIAMFNRKKSQYKKWHRFSWSGK
ncbi:hypothetical protein C6P45_003741 [Maudiozyma exigua]|uniref:Uncharacterized protein n=1 Tax=Maudiozyma exigua TaxID=34358 RepID=A0A9P6WBG1_MAUEX|nr:hypothetical protein C6P45_003741 [Kazachstania exigua]